MATTKTTKKAPARKAPVKSAKPVKTVKTTAKKPVSKAVVAKKPVAKKTSKQSAASMQSFRVYKDQDSFTSFRVTRQTFYWVILVAFIIFAQLWILKLQVEISDLLTQQQITLTETE